jgi:hypothetical protein
MVQLISVSQPVDTETKNTYENLHSILGAIWRKNLSPLGPVNTN